MKAPLRVPRGFSTLNGRQVFDNGERKRWRCPVCAWWRDWDEQRCCGCGLRRDPVTVRAKARAAGAS